MHAAGSRFRPARPHRRGRLALAMALAMLVGAIAIPPTDAGLAMAALRAVDPEPVPGDTAPVDLAPEDPAPSDPEPADPEPSDPGPSDPEPSDPEPSDPTPSEPTPVDPTPEPGTDEPAPTESTGPDAGATPAPSDPVPSTSQPAPTQRYNPEPAIDLGQVRFVDLRDLDGARQNPAASADLAELARSQLSTIDEALRRAKREVELAGEAYDEALREAEDAQAVVDALVDEAAALEGDVALSDTTLAMMVQRMRSGSYVMPPELTVFLEVSPDDDLLYQYGLLSALSSEEARAGETARVIAVEIDRLLADARTASEEADRLAEAALKVRDDAVLAQQSLERQVALAQQHRGELVQLLAALGIDVPDATPLTELTAARDSLRTSAGGAVNALGWAAPISGGSVTSHYGYRTHPVEGSYRMHNGTDFTTAGGTCGAPLYAVGAGTVIYAGWLGTYGNHIEILLDDGTIVSYSHIMNGGLGVAVGARVVAGQAIALAGTTGASTGCHLHFEVKVNGANVEPLGWLAARGW